MLRRDRFAVHVFAVPGVFGDFADADDVGIEKITKRFDVLRNFFRVVRQIGGLGIGLALVDRHLCPVDMTHGGVERVLGDEAPYFMAGLGSEIAEERAHEKTGALGKTLDVVGDQGCRLIDALDLFHGKPAHVERPFAF